MLMEIFLHIIMGCLTILFIVLVVGVVVFLYKLWKAVDKMDDS